LVTGTGVQDCFLGWYEPGMHRVLKLVQGGYYLLGTAHCAQFAAPFENLGSPDQLHASSSEAPHWAQWPYFPAMIQKLSPTKGPSDAI